MENIDDKICLEDIKCDNDTFGLVNDFETLSFNKNHNIYYCNTDGFINNSGKKSMASFLISNLMLTLTMMLLKII